MYLEWVRSLRDQCALAGVAFLFKQWGEWYPAHTDSEDDRITLPDGSRIEITNENGDALVESHLWNSTCADPVTQYSISVRIGKKRAGRLLDGVQHDGYPLAA